MATKPSVQPDWAENDVVDGTSGQNNKIEPPTAWKNNGWSYQEKPPRNYDNYVKWNLGQWIKYLDLATVRGPTYKVAASNSATDSQNQADAVCDGTADETEINAAITAVAATGGVVLLSEGTYNLSSPVILDDNVHLVGLGQNATILAVATASIGPSAISATSKQNMSIANLSINGNSGGRSTDDRGIDLSGCSSVVIKDVTVSSVSRDSSNGEGLRFSNCSQVKCLGVTASSCEGDGFEVSSDATSSRISFTDCFASSCGGNGFLNGGQYTSYSNCRALSCDSGGFAEVAASPTLGGSYSGCEATNCAQVNPAQGFSVYDQARLSGCIATGTANAGGFRTDGDFAIMTGCISTNNANSGFSVNGQGNVISNCVSTVNGNSGISIESGSTENTVMGCYISSNGSSALDTYSGILLAQDDNLVCNNIVKVGAADAQRYGIGWTSTGGGSYIFGNDLVNSSRSGGAGGPIGTDGIQPAKTIPEWIGSAAGTNVQDDVTKANRVA